MFRHGIIRRKKRYKHKKRKKLKRKERKDFNIPPNDNYNYFYA